MLGDHDISDTALETSFLPASSPAYPAPVHSMNAPAPPLSGPRRVIDVIVERGYASREQVDAIGSAAREAGVSAEQLLVARGIISPEQRAMAVAERLGLEFVDLSSHAIDVAAVSLLPTEIAEAGDVLRDRMLRKGIAISAIHPSGVRRAALSHTWS